MPMRYVKFVTKDSQDHDHDTGDNAKDVLFVPGDATDILLSR